MNERGRAVLGVSPGQDIAMAAGCRGHNSAQRLDPCSDTPMPCRSIGSIVQIDQLVQLPACSD